MIIVLLLVAVALVGYVAGRMRAAPVLLDALAVCGLLLLIVLSGGDALAPAGGASGLVAGLYSGSIGAVKRARGLAPHQRLRAVARRRLAR